MPRTARASVGGMWYHALNRGNRREAVFLKPIDYDAFVETMSDARAGRVLPWTCWSYCLMPNHFRLVLVPRADSDLWRWTTGDPGVRLCSLFLSEEPSDAS